MTGYFLIEKSKFQNLSKISCYHLLFGFLNFISINVVSKYFPFLMKEAERQPGDRWMIRGPQEYVPPIQVIVLTKCKAIPLDENEGIYVRHVKSGKVSAQLDHMSVRIFFLVEI